jgi:Ca2+/Na+ antiporter
MWKMGLIFLISALAIVGASIFIAINTNWILSNSWGWKIDSPKTGFGYSLLLGIVTSIPETITVITLLKLKNVNAAISDILGSNMFSCLILSIVDLIYWHGNDTLFGKGSQEALMISFWCFVSMIFIGGMLLVNYLFRHGHHNKVYYALNITMLSFVFLTYVAYLILSAMNVQIFWPINPDPGPTLHTSINDCYNLIDSFKVHLLNS